ncbi:hypothetical protein KHQ89_06130 [Mycoplasmatota bacterium]|nr:hypothetical protein KHQ89_06130 [Mycoplasmatota bacterium]
MRKKLINQLKTNWITLLFIMVELLLWFFILFIDSPFELHVIPFVSITLCLVYVLLNYKNNIDYKIMLIAFVFTLSADYFLTLTSTQTTLGTFLFFLSQLMFMLRLHFNKNKLSINSLIPYAVIFMMLSMIIFFALNTFDLLLLVSVLYYSFLLINTFYAWLKKDKYIMFAIALTLYVFADTMVGIKASDPYITFNPQSLLYFLSHISFNIIWFFYLPSQVLFALSVKFNHVNKGEQHV